MISSVTWFNLWNIIKEIKPSFLFYLMKSIVLRAHKDRYVPLPSLREVFQDLRLWLNQTELISESS